MNARQVMPHLMSEQNRQYGNAEREARHHKCWIPQDFKDIHGPVAAHRLVEIRHEQR